MKNAAAIHAAAIHFAPVQRTVKRIALSLGMMALALAAGGVALAQTRGDAKNGAQLSAMCAGCHGINGLRNAYPEVYRIPKIGGQHPEYIVAALQGYRSGERNHPTMRAIASSLTDQAMADLAAYYSQGGLRAAPAGK